LGIWDNFAAGLLVVLTDAAFFLAAGFALMAGAAGLRLAADFLAGSAFFKTVFLTFLSLAAGFFEGIQASGANAGRT